jgi:8-oxo-dGTP diphosphatase
MTFVYAVAFLFDKFVMVRNTERGWEMPGGEVEQGETPEDAIKREFTEETGLGLTTFSHTDIPGGKVFFGVVEITCGGCSSCASGCPGSAADSHEPVVETSFFDELPEELSFSRGEYEMMLQEGKIALKKYINRNSIGDDAPPE